MEGPNRHPNPKAETVKSETLTPAPHPLNRQGLDGNYSAFDNGHYITVARDVCGPYYAYALGLAQTVSGAEWETYMYLILEYVSIYIVFIGYYLILEHSSIYI